MSDRIAILLRYAKLDNLGWRRGSLAETKNHRHNPAAMIYNGTEYTIPADSHYQIRHFKDGKTVFTPAGRDFETASQLLKQYVHSRTLEESQKALGIYVPEVKERTTLAEQLKAYLTSKNSPLNPLSPASIYVYKTTLTSFVEYCGRDYAEDVTQADVLAFLEHLKADGYAKKVWVAQTDGSKVQMDGERQGYSDKSIRMRYTTIRGFLKRCGVNVGILIDGSLHKRLSAKEEANTEPYSDEQLNRLFASCDEYHEQVFRFLLGTGLREQEAAHLKWENVDFIKNLITVVAKNTDANGKVKQQTKNRKSRVVPMAASVRAQLLAWRVKNPDTVYVLGSRRSDKPSNHWIEYLKKYWTAANLGDTSEAYLHRFRHTFAHKALHGGVPIDVVKECLGHHSLEVTQIYLSGEKKFDVDPFAQMTNPKVVSIREAVA
jgi:integrase